MARLSNDSKIVSKNDSMSSNVIDKLNSKNLREIYAEIYKQNSSMFLFESKSHKSFSHDEKIIHSPHLCKHI